MLLAQPEEVVVPVAVCLAEPDEFVNVSLLWMFCEFLRGIAVAEHQFGFGELGVQGPRDVFRLRVVTLQGDTRALPGTHGGRVVVLESVQERNLAGAFQTSVAAHEVVRVLARDRLHRTAALVKAGGLGVFVCLVVGTDLRQHDFIPGGDRRLGLIRCHVVGVVEHGH